MTNSKGKKDDKQSKKLIIAVVVTAIVIIAALIAVIVVLLNREPEVIYEPVIQLIPGPGRGGYERNPGGRGFVITEETVDAVRAEIAERRLDPEDMSFEFNKTSNWRFPTSRTPSPNAMVRNLETNSRMIFFDVYIQEFGVVYVSPYMPLGSVHRRFALEDELPAGSYSALVTYFLVDDDFEILTDVTVGVIITIEH